MEKSRMEKILEEKFTKEEYLIRLSDVNKSLVVYKDDEFSTNELILRKKELEVILSYFDNQCFNKHKCKICGKDFELKKENKYIANSINLLISKECKSESFDCPYCGCQNIVNSYYERVQS